MLTIGGDLYVNVGDGNGGDEIVVGENGYVLRNERDKELLA